MGSIGVAAIFTTHASMFVSLAQTEIRTFLSTTNQERSTPVPHLLIDPDL